MIDTHCHLASKAFAGRVDEVVADALAAGVTRMITVGTSPVDSEACVACADRYEQVFATVGVHPGESGKWQDKAAVVEPLRQLAKHPRVVALGEMGLDLYYDDPPLDQQQRVLEWQLDLARELPDLPIVIHNREATQETLAVLRESGISGSRFVFHCFTGSASELDLILELGAMVSFTGIVTFNNARSIAEAATRVPRVRIMVETDAPYLTPEPHRKVRPNEPKYVRHTAAFLAEQFEMSEQDFIELSDANAARFFRLAD